MLEAKAKDQEHRRKCSQKKKGLQKFFQAISEKGKQISLRTFSARFLAFSFLILKTNKSLLLQEPMQMRIALYGDPTI